MTYAYGPYIKEDISSLSEIAISSFKLKKSISSCIIKIKKKFQAKRKLKLIHNNGECNKLANQ